MAPPVPWGSHGPLFSRLINNPSGSEFCETREREKRGADGMDCSFGSQSAKLHLPSNSPSVHSPILPSSQTAMHAQPPSAFPFSQVCADVQMCKCVEMQHRRLAVDLALSAGAPWHGISSHHITSQRSAKQSTLGFPHFVLQGEIGD